MDLRRTTRLALAALLFSLSALSYALFVPGESTVLLLLGVAFFAAGFQIGSTVSPTLRRFRPSVPLAAFVVLGEWFFFTNNLTGAVLDSRYALALTSFTSWAATGVLNILGVAATQSGDSIVITSASSKLHAVSVQTACSGAEGFLLFVAAAGLLAVEMRGRIPWKKLVVSFLSGSLAVYGLTLLRIPITILVGYAYGPAAMETFHLYAGMLMFLVAIAAYWWISLRWFGVVGLPKKAVEAA